MAVFSAFVRRWSGWRARALVICLGLAACASPPQEPARAPAKDVPGAAPVTIVAFGDMPYRTVDFPAYEDLLRRVSDAAPDVTINVGDIKGGGPCDEAIYLRQRDYMNSVAGPLVYTPGDNEWTD